MGDMCPLPSWIGPLLGLVRQAQPQASPDPALSGVLILLSSAPCATREGLRGRTRSEEGIEPVSLFFYIS